MGGETKSVGSMICLSCGGIQEKRERGFCLLLVFKDIHSAYKKNK